MKNLDLKLQKSKIFVNMVIHDLKNPVLSLQSGIELATRKIKNIDQYSEL